jgi:hypothetical protein
MSLSEDQPIACPSCGKPSSFRIQRSVDAARDPELVLALLDGRLFSFTCPSCAHRARVVHPELCFVDPPRDLVVQLDAAGRFDLAAAAAAWRPLPKTTRLVRDGNALVEKVRIAQAGLDDRVVEAMKLLARASLGPQAEGKRMLFEDAHLSGDAGRLRFTLLGRDGSVAGLGLPRATYDQLAADLGARGRLLDPGPWGVVDDVIAQAMLAP